MARRGSRNRLKSAEKGLHILPSYRNPIGTATSRMQWKRHEGKNQKIRNLRRVCRDVLDSKDPEVLEVTQRAREFVSGKFEELGLLMMIYQAMEVSDLTGIDFAESLDYIIEKLKKDKEGEEDEPEKRN